MAKTYRDNSGRMTDRGFKDYRRTNTEIIARQSEIEVEKKHKVPNPDTEHRLEIQNLIKKLLLENKSKIEILTILNKQYSDSKLSKYFSSYIDNKIYYLEKHKKLKGISREDE